MEDNEDILFNIKLLLESNNYQVITANDGKKAIETLSKPKISFFDSLKIKEIFKEISKQIKAKNQPDLAVYREKILNLFQNYKYILICNLFFKECINRCVKYLVKKICFIYYIFNSFF